MLHRSSNVGHTITVVIDEMDSAISTHLTKTIHRVEITHRLTGLQSGRFPHVTREEVQHLLVIIRGSRRVPDILPEHTRHVVILLDITRILEYVILEDLLLRKRTCMPTLKQIKRIPYRHILTLECQLVGSKCISTESATRSIATFTHC